MTKLYERSLTHRVKLWPNIDWFTLHVENGISVSNFPGDGLFNFKKTQNIQNFLSFQTPFPLP